MARLHRSPAPLPAGSGEPLRPAAGVAGLDLALATRVPLVATGAKAHREIFEAHFRAPCSDVLQSLPTLLFDPGQPFFETPWTRAGALLRSPAPEAFSDAEFWAITMQLFGGDVEAAAAQARQWASDLARRGIAGRGHRRDVWWSRQVGLLEASATGTYL